MNEEAIRIAKKTSEATYLAINHYGMANQLSVLVEELAELIQAIQKYIRNDSEKNFDNLIEEIADVEIGLHYVLILVNGEDPNSPELISQIIEKKIDRLLLKISSEKENVN